ncbi:MULTISPECIES: DUF4259 domain-containing protein [Streptomyces]|uniref:DUF4259 domain-containing protein n=1 Tax=Streptomyces glycanivorans TaxID=3033808 RepID=A0ABY9JCM0_9ACTN|nr:MULTISPECIES: DUF4259 domain-containing protein [unclassified Streptomyces]WSQ78903.1 DUF4259 domain-containing protein [Streptomyces sp. NBC_01213]WLQ65523.1 DUF4259 domain-containing protein [Streptomyces sp. Alt3]WSQ86272.1 DUF4259 domain-containing protein [Streptomyces sp. NBC_01212]WSR07646.1 DUF4259 domain-containing protein [Streptomyces sp. NBC_01208]WSR49616.1 DUF4259 domain-containing protein [Streptomyces sp. NBC_01201]
MGTWGAGNFDSDTAADHLAALTDRLVTEVTEAMAGDPVELEPDEYRGVTVPCNLELLLVLARQGWVGVILPPPEVIRAWQQTFLAVWERTIDGLEPDPAYKDERRAVLDGTFEQLAAASAAAK